MEETCLFCLEPLQGNPTGTILDCSCKIFVHESCLHAWYTQKQCFECPICHTITIQNPIVVVVSQRNQETEETYQRHQKLAAGCCCILLFWAISLLILDFVFAK